MKILKRILLKQWFIVTLLATSAGCSRHELLYYVAPSVLPDTTRQMKTVGFWIARHPFPDQVMMTSEEIQLLNQQIEKEMKLTRDIFQWPSPLVGESLKKTLVDQMNYVSQQKFYLTNGRRLPVLDWDRFKLRSHAAPARFWQEMVESMDLDNLPKTINPQYGVIVHYADQRVLPTLEGLYAKPFDIDFDELQNSTLDIGTPVVVVHTSRDGQWVYVVSKLSDGWITKDRVAMCSLDELKKNLSGAFVVALRAKVDIFLDQGLTEYYDYVRMGVALSSSFEEISQDVVQVVCVQRDFNGRAVFKNAYVRRKDINQGYLPYTPRQMIQQAFELLNTPYGWGGMYGEQDCSAFLQEIFASAGIFLPRNSSQQRLVGKSLGEFEQNVLTQKKQEILVKQGIGGMTVLGMNGHIMLFLGEVNGIPYAIHDTWAYRERKIGKDHPRVINRVVVTDLSLGAGSKKGSLLERLKTIRVIDQE